MTFLDTSIENGWGIITLNRRQALNALNFDMVRGFSTFLDRVESNANIKGVLIQSALPQYFCVGGDIKDVYLNFQNDQNHISQMYLEEEYALNLKLANLSKPSIVLIDGLNLGGGVGISRYAKYRIITENAKIGMPEVKIAFFPDVGAGYFLNKLPTSVARFLAITGSLVEGEDAISTGYGTHYVESSSLSQIKEKIVLSDIQDIVTILQTHEAPTPSSILLKPNAKTIDFFNHDSLEGVILKLAESQHPLAKKLSMELQEYSPLSLKVIWMYMKITQNIPHAEVMELDKSLARSFIEKSDFMEGIRTLLITKTDAPNWIYHCFTDVSAEVLSDFFASASDAAASSASTSKILR